MGNNRIGVVCYADDGAMIVVRKQLFQFFQASHQLNINICNLYWENQTHDSCERTAQMQACGGGQTHRTGDAIQISGRRHIKRPWPSWRPEESD